MDARLVQKFFNLRNEVAETMQEFGVSGDSYDIADELMTRFNISSVEGDEYC